jgi:hypothetical protein
MSPNYGLEAKNDGLTDWLTDCQQQYDSDSDPVVTWQTRPLDREDAPWKTKPQLSWLQSKSGHDPWKGLVSKTHRQL